MIIVTGAVTATPEGLDAMLAEARRHVARSRAEPGCVSHDWYRDPEDERRIVFLERWADLASLRAHFAQPGSAAFMAAVRRLAAAVEPLSIFEANPVAP